MSSGQLQKVHNKVRENRSTDSKRRIGDTLRQRRTLQNPTYFP